MVRNALARLHDLELAVAIDEDRPLSRPLPRGDADALAGVRQTAAHAPVHVRADTKEPAPADASSAAAGFAASAHSDDTSAALAECARFEVSHPAAALMAALAAMPTLLDVSASDLWDHRSLARAARFLLHGRGAAGAGARPVDMPPAGFLANASESADWR